MSYPNPGDGPDDPTGNSPSESRGQAGQWESSTPNWAQQSPGNQSHGQSPGWQHHGDWQQQWQRPSPQTGSFGQPPPQSPPPPGGGLYGPQPPPARRSISDANPFRAAFDFGFNSYATPGLVKIIYVLAVILAAVWWLGGAFMVFMMGAAASNLATSSPYGDSGDSGAGGFVLVGLFVLLLGWIPALLWLLLVRIALEASMALVRVADDLRHLRQNAGM